MRPLLCPISPCVSANYLVAGLPASRRSSTQWTLGRHGEGSVSGAQRIGMDEGVGTCQYAYTSRALREGIEDGPARRSRFVACALEVSFLRRLGQFLLRSCSSPSLLPAPPLNRTPTAVLSLFPAQLELRSCSSFRWEISSG